MTLSRVLIFGPPASDLADGLGMAVARLGASPLRVSTLTDALAILEQGQPDAIGVEVGRHFLEGLEAIRSLHIFSSAPIIALASPDEGSTVSRALDIGADDYLTAIPRPESLIEARLEALHRRATAVAAAAGATARVRELTVDFDRCEAFLGEHLLKLTPTEFRLLTALVRNAGRMMTAQRLMREALGEQLAQSEARDIVRVHVRRLRAKMLPFEKGSSHIVTVRGFGYMLERRSTRRPGDPLAGYVEQIDPMAATSGA